MKKFEKGIKRALKGAVSAAELLQVWEGLGAEGDRFLIDFLNRHKAWKQFVQVIGQEGRSKLQAIAEFAGIGPEAEDALRSAGVEFSGADSPRTRARSILEIATGADSTNFSRAYDMMLHDPVLFQALLPLLEQQEREGVLSFLQGLLEKNIDGSQDQALRKTLYKMRQRGIAPATSPAAATARREFFVFAENRAPFWQPVFYFRAHSVYGDTGDLFLIHIEEGRDFRIADQKQNVIMTAANLRQVADDYSRKLEEQTRMKFPFHLMTPGEARYFLHKSASLIKESRAASGLNDFLRFLGPSPFEIPESSKTTDAGSILEDQTAYLFRLPYFGAWAIDAEELRSYFDRLDQIAQGPIVLPEAQQAERKRTLEREALTEYFSAERRLLWAFAFEKAAFFLRLSDAQESAYAQSISFALSNMDLPVESVPAAGLLFLRGVEMANYRKKKEEEEQKRGSLIMSPDEFQKMQRK